METTLLENHNTELGRLYSMSIEEINEKTKISVSFKIIIPILTSLIIMTWIVSQKLNAMDAKLNAMDSFWTVRDQQKWADETQKNNPAIKVPFVSDILSARK